MNPRHRDFQSLALPTELPARNLLTDAHHKSSAGPSKDLGDLWTGPPRSLAETELGQALQPRSIPRGATVPSLCPGWRPHDTSWNVKCQEPHDISGGLNTNTVWGG